MSPSGQRLSPAELASLEHAFASDPASNAYRPLAEAYLGMDRFMEAMVVAKRGIKNHPDDPAPRLLLARVHAAQRKDERAMEVLGEALQLAPRNAEALRFLATIQLRRGSREEGLATLRRAWEAAPDDAETLALASQYGAKFERPAPAPLPAAASTASAPGSPVTPKASGSAAEIAPGPGEAAGSAAAVPQIAPRRAPVAPQLEEEPETTHARSRAALVVTGVLVLVLAVVLAGWGIASGVKKRRAVEIDHLLRQSRDLIDKDAFVAYRDAARLCDRILEKDPDAIGGHAYLAYVDAIRWGELGESDALRGDAQRHLDAVKKTGRTHSHAYAAQAYLRAWGGDVPGAIAELQQVLKGPEGASPLLRGVLGILQLQAGDLDGARDALTAARQQAPGDVRLTEQLAEQWRRRGKGFEPQANALYDAVLVRLEPDHVPSLLGKAQLLLDSGEPAEALKRIGRVLDLGQAAAPRQIALANELRNRVQAERK